MQSTHMFPIVLVEVPTEDPTIMIHVAEFFDAVSKNVTVIDGFLNEGDSSLELRTQLTHTEETIKRLRNLNSLAAKPWHPVSDKMLDMVVKLRFTYNALVKTYEAVAAAQSVEPTTG